MGDVPSEARFTIANPGHIPWMRHTAEAAARRGVLRALYEPSAYPAEFVERVSALPLGRISTYVAEQLSRRAVDDQIAEHLVRVGSAAEVVAVLARRAGVGVRQTADLRDIIFDQAVATRLSTASTAVLCAYHSSLATIRRARELGVRSSLDWPVAHHRFALQVLTEEVERRPGYADTMQFHEVPARRARRLDEELAEADVVTVPSTFQRRTFEHWGVDGDKIAVVPFGVDSERYRPAPSEPEGPFRILFVGQLTQRKGLSYVIDAFLAADLPDSELVLLGAEVGGLPEDLGRSGIHHVPEVRPEAVPAFYRTAHVFILPSFVEGLARVVLEAMATGLPIVVTPNTGAEDVMEDGREGFVVPERDVDAIIDRLHHLHRDPEARTSMGRHARETAQRYTWRRYADQMLAVAASR